MRTTLNLDEDLVPVLKKAARRGGLSFTAVVNETLRAGLTKRGGRARPRRYRIEPASLGGARAELDLDRALRLADELEERAIASKLALPALQTSLGLEARTAARWEGRVRAERRTASIRRESR